MATEVKKQQATTQSTKPAVDTNVYRLSLKNLFKQSVFISKIIMKKHGSVQLESVGAATSEASRIAQTLVKHGYAKIKSINTEQFNTNNDKARFQIKLTIVLEKGADFDKLTQTINVNK